MHERGGGVAMKFVKEGAGLANFGPLPFLFLFLANLRPLFFLLVAARIKTLDVTATVHTRCQLVVNLTQGVSTMCHIFPRDVDLWSADFTHSTPLRGGS